MDVIVKAWESLEWESFQQRVEEEIKAIEFRQDADDVSKKSLLEESAAYREATTKETRKVAVPLIKAFQSEVDRLSSCNKASEASLIDICARVVNLPDPLPILQKAPAWKVQAEKTNNAIEEAEQLRNSISDLHAEFADLQNQDVTIRKLRERIKQLEGEKTNEVEQSITDTERKLKEEFVAREFEMNMRAEKLKNENVLLEKKVTELEIKMRDAQRKLDVARMRADQKETLESEQLEILSRDLESANRRVSILEREVERLTNDLAEAQTASKRGGLEDIAVIGCLMKEKDDQIARLQAENLRLSDSIQVDSKSFKLKYENLEKDVKRQTDMMKELQSKLIDQQDYDAIKKELRLLREIEFGEAASANEDSILKLGETVQTLDKLLAEKNRRLQNSNAELRVSNDKFKGDDIMQAILAGSHHSVVEAVSKRVGKEVVEQYVDPDLESALDRQIERAKKAQDKLQTSDTTTIEPKKEEKTNLLKILMAQSNNSVSLRTTRRQPTPPLSSNARKNSDAITKSDIPFEQFRYSPKLTNYSGEPSKTPQEVKAIQELQSIVASNIRSLGNRALNTAEIAKQCKRLMVAYNIGQRLFAKYVMNQSQGSLSELLSKPRHWSKLTDKGREAFRRIYGWISDDGAIEALCSLSPRRVWPNDSEVKVDHPSCESLWESNSNKLPPEEPDDKIIKRVSSAREDQYRLAGTTQAANSGSSQRNSRWRHDDIPKEKIMSIFQSELAKLREQETNLERAIASRTITGGHVRKMDDLNSSYHEMSQSERMASINHAHQVMCARMKAGLTPITQEEFELFGHIDTEDIVRQIKDFLSMNSISQRQFGEHVLGLSQGSVSDLLARPKQWNMLTQKGREPFIRMKLFMQEVALTAERSRESSEFCEKESSVESNDEIIVLDERSPSPKDNPLHAIITRTPLDLEKREDSPCSPSDQSALVDGPDDLDTGSLVRKVKDRLHIHGISQRMFGETVLGISAGGTSEIFLRPRPWNTLNCRAKEPYLKMKIFLEDKDAIIKLLTKEKLEPSSPPAIPDTTPINMNGKRSSTYVVVDTHIPRKVQRTVITDQQKEALRFVFQHEHHPSQKTIELLALKLNLNIRTVNNWFHNHRTRQKASLKEGKIYSSAVASLPKSKNWQQDLATMLDQVASSGGFESNLPTMVPFPPLFSNDEIRDELENTIEKERPNTISQQEQHIAEFNEKCTSQEELIARLEKDLSLFSYNSSSLPNKEDENLSTLEVLESLDKSISIKSEEDGSVTAILTAQRDRYRQKVDQLEEDLALEKTRQSVLSAEIEKLKEDNVKIYAKVKFLQCYGNNGGQQGDVAISLDTSTNYNDQYERKLDPFRKFRQQENQRSYTKLKIHDRASLSIGKAILSSSSARLMFFFYLLFMHVLVFVVLYRFAYTESCDRDFQQDCVERFSQHMKQHHHTD
ncbi:unnamed protein product [Auanema sp. JU1783]|nr:unnamed protein product [Auanema sp. JU1783]